MKKRFLLPLTAAVSVASLSAAAANDDGLVVTATRIAQTTDQTLVPVSVITREDIENSSARSLPELLQSLPGVDISVSGGPGQPASVYLRGTSFNHTLVLIDGVRAGSATLGSFAFHQIPLSQIERIEVVRGPRSSLYGSDAIGGVIQIFTRKSAQTGVSVRVAAGSEQTRQTASSFAIVTDSTRLNLTMGYFDTDGINARIGDNPDDDGYENSSASLSLEQSLGAGTEARLSFMRAASENHYDDPWNSTADNYARNLQQSAAFSLSHNYSDAFTLSASVNQYRDESDSFDSWPTKISTRRDGADIKGDLYLSDDTLASLGADYYREKVSNSTSNYSKDSRHNSALFAQLQQQLGALNLLVGARYDDSSAYGSKTTGNVNLGYEVAPGHRVLAGFGTAFKAPTFNDLYWPGSGNPDLKPEESRNLELGYEGTAGSLQYAVRLFRNRIDDLIVWQDTGGFVFKPFNVNSATIRGTELEVAGSLSGLDLSAQLTLLDTEDESTGKPLPNRAEKLFSVGAGRDYGRFDWRATLVAQGERGTLPGYGLVGFKAGYALDENLLVSAEVSNLFDKEYSTNVGYNGAGRSWLLSLSYRN